jgi:hypothetical protein
MPSRRTPEEWLKAAIDARSVAVVLTLPADRLAWARIADECEEMAQFAGKLIKTEAEIR